MPEVQKVNVIELGRVHFSGSFASTLSVSAALDRAKKENPSLDISWTHDPDDYRKTWMITIIGTPRFVLPIRTAP
jgi:hypothetical protein